MRKLVTVRRIDEIVPIEGADAIELAKIGGWQLVVKKAEFAVGDLCAYFEIDSFLPIAPEYEFLRKSSFRRMGEHEGFRIRTIKLRGQISQGLALPIGANCPPKVYDAIRSSTDEELFDMDFTEAYGVVKYEPPMPVELAGQVEGNFPSFIPKTDEERCQNIVHNIFVENENSRYEVSLKLDGTSFTAYYNSGDDGVCSRNWELKVNEANESNMLIRMFITTGLRDALRKLGKNYAIQCELVGPGIQGNKESFKSHKLYVFKIYDIDNKCYLAPETRHEVLHTLHSLGLNKDLVDHVPVISMAESLEDLGIFGIAGLLAFADGPSINAKIREGLVFKRIDGGFSFKVISNKWLLKHDE